MNVRRLTVATAAIVSLGLVSLTAGQESNEQPDAATLYQVDVETGEATEVGAIGDDLSVVGLALAPQDEASTESEAGTAYALTTDGVLVEFALDDPSELTNEVEVSGLEDDEALVGIDVRPATGEIFAVSDASVIYSVDPESGEATALGEAFDPALEDSFVGFDFNPTVDRIRAAVSTGQNLRLNPENGQIGMNPDTGAPTIDGQLTYAEGDDNAGEQPLVVAAGYTNSFDGAEETQLFVIDAELDVLTLQDPPNDGVLNTVGELGVDATELTAFDIAAPAEDAAEGDAVEAYAAISPASDDGATPIASPVN